MNNKIPSLKSSFPGEKIPRSAAFFSALWAYCVQSAPRKAVDSVLNFSTVRVNEPIRPPAPLLKSSPWVDDTDSEFSATKY